MNEEVKIGDRIMLAHMDGEMLPSLGSKGTVISISPDPFESDNLIINVRWDMGSTLNVLSKYDVYLKLNQNVNEQRDPNQALLTKNLHLFKYYDVEWLKNYLEKVRQTGAINMFGAGDWLIAGRDHLDRYYGEDREDNEAFQEVLDMADEARMKIITGTVKYLESKGDEITPRKVEMVIKDNLRKFLTVWMVYLH